jgi:hypothetical protein
MTDLDLDRLGDVWRQQPDPAEMERLRRSAAAVSRRARLARVVDVGAALALAAAVIALVALNPTVKTSAMGVAAILILLGVNIHQRRLRHVQLKSLTGSTENMLDQSIERIETTLGHNRFSLIAAGPVLLVGLIFMAVVGRGLDSVFGAAFRFPGLRMVALAMIAGTVAYLLFAIRRSRRELARLRAMREAYHQEQEKSAP